MIKELIATSFVAAIASAEPPIVDVYHPDQHSYTHRGVVETGHGKILVTLRNFGIEDCQPAREFGARLADVMVMSPDQAKITTENRARELYPNSRTDQDGFFQQARLGYVAESIALKQQVSR